MAATGARSSRCPACTSRRATTRRSRRRSSWVCASSKAALAALTHDPKIDDWPLAEALRRNCFYVGALGSRKTHARRVDRLKEAGLSSSQIERIHAPIGLDIAASSPQEIAVAVMAQIISAFRKRGQIAENAAEEERILDA